MDSDQIVVTLAPEHNETRVLMATEHQDILKAVLPAPAFAHPRAAATLLEGLALWHQKRLSVVLLVDESDCSSAGLSLCDAIGFGERRLHYEVGIASRNRRRPGRRRIHGIGDFRDLRQLSLNLEVQ